MQVDLELSLPGGHDGADGLDGHEVRDDLRRWLRPHIGEVKPVDIDALPDDRRGVAEVLALAVSTVATTVQVITLVRDWLAARRGKGADPVSVTVIIDAEAITITDPLTGREAKAVEAFIRRHDREDIPPRGRGGRDDHA